MIVPGPVTAERVGIFRFAVLVDDQAGPAVRGASVNRTSVYRPGSAGPPAGRDQAGPNRESSAASIVAASGPIFGSTGSGGVASTASHSARAAGSRNRVSWP